MTEHAGQVRTRDAASDFLAHRRWAITGVSRDGAGHGANVVYQRLRERGYDVYAVNPNADEVEGDPAYPSLRAVPGGVDVVMVGTRPERAEATVREALELGVTRIWMHRAFGAGSVSEDAAALARAGGATVIDGACPCMYAPTDDGGHRFLRHVCALTGAVPRRV